MLTLQPFEATAPLQPFSLKGDVCWRGTILQVHFRLLGPLEQLVNLDRERAGQHQTPQRRDQLWQSTCFEAFVGTPQHRHYWEVNLACTGDWNVYRLDDYRTNLRPEAQIAELPYRLLRRPDQLDLSFQLDWNGLVPPKAIDLSLTAVLDHREQGCSYWALQHVNSEPDFHQRGSFQRFANGITC